MKEQVLTIEQMQHLYDLSVDNSKASMCWITQPGSRIYVLSVHNESCHEMPSLNPIPTFSLQDLLEIIPKTLWYTSSLELKKRREDDDSMKVDFVLMYNHIAKLWTCTYVDEEGTEWVEGNAIMQGKTPLEASYKMLCWLLENELLK